MGGTPMGGRPTRPAARVLRLDERDQRRPRHHLLHVAQELLSPRLALLARAFQARKADQLHAPIMRAAAGRRHRA